MKQTHICRVLGGLAIAAVGGLFILHQMGMLGFQHLDIGGFISRYWPLVPLLMGLSTLFSGGSLWAGAAMVLFGLVMLGRNMGFSYWSFGDAAQFLLPVVAIVFGLRMVFSRGGRRQRHEEPEDDGEWTSYTSYQGPVPPAPPLHPDPLHPDAGPGRPGEGGRPGKDGQPPYGGQGPAGNAAGGYEERGAGWSPEPDRPMDWKRAKHEFKQARREYRDAHRRHRHHGHGRGSHHHGRTEWWNTDPNAQTRSNFIGDIHLGHDYWDLVPLNISHFIGDTVLDLTRANIPAGETKITISSFIGDVKVFLPADSDVGIQVVSSAFIGDSKVLGRKEGGMFQHSDTQSPSFRESERKIKLVCSTFIGDVRVTKVG
ncbi:MULTISPECIES: cell wall-active antibiotics response protein LiaF [unclassified Paenibacillus]|uniref:cell wall-active antibiotics response protein LiaF n=1 Tax=unclassified Paenibacillus TaxID=185978 RepID=UPI000954A241|nr:MULTISPECIES: cell wall-active antibiotics response protein LiaF [unclassified Paenibacillus]SIQ00549.1 lia operon protein LiaF [Paenibacillus sp. RU4X]SIQ19702.1 lia operon protein LiaF [Paenibacillus sp. RU4T]